MIFSRISQDIDKKQLEALTSPVDPSARATSTSLQQKTPIALLTERQRFILNNEHGRKKPVLIVGGAGTGKTLLLLAKIQRLHDEGKLNEKAKALVVIAEHQAFLGMSFRAVLARYDGTVIVRSLQTIRDEEKLGLGGVLEALKDPENMHTKYLFVDQVEDFLGLVHDVWQQLAAFCGHEQLKLMWFLWNVVYYNRLFRPTRLGWNIARERLTKGESRFYVVQYFWYKSPKG
jgi:hypothetical protein